LAGLPPNVCRYDPSPASGGRLYRYTNKQSLTLDPNTAGSGVHAAYVE
jgi:hypothetical protein